MTRDAEHTPTGYEDAASVVVNQAPAPSSLAGGSVSRAVACVDQVASGAQVSEVYGGEWCLDPALEFRAHLRAILAALSPEAPARLRADMKLEQRLRDRAKVSTDPMLAMLARQAADALTPRHEAPAEDDDGPCTCCNDTGITIQTERPCACAAGVPFESPAEGAGEDFRHLTSKISPVICNHGTSEQHEAWLELLRAFNGFRARSSAPEAREGEAVAGAALAKAMWGIDLVPAAPSADKLRIAVEALERGVKRCETYERIRLRGRSETAKRAGTLRNAMADMTEALATLKAVGA